MSFAAACDAMRHSKQIVVARFFEKNRDAIFKDARMATLMDVRPGEPQEAQRFCFKIARKLHKNENSEEVL